MDSDKLQDYKELFKVCVEAEKENRDEAIDDLNFSRLSQQWPDEIRRKRQLEGRPCLTINKLPAFIKQVVNDARLNKPALKCSPVDDKADPQTALILDGLIRNIEYMSNADIAYDTALDCSVTSGVGYFRIRTDYAHDDTFEQDIIIDRIANPFSVYRDPYSLAADSSDWNHAFILSSMTKAEFEKKYKGADSTDWENEYNAIDNEWLDGDNIILAEYWCRKESPRLIVQLNDGTVLDADRYKQAQDVFYQAGLTVVGDRIVKSYKTQQYIMSGAEILEENAWPGRYIPIVPVYGEEVNVEGKRYLKSLIRDAKDSSRMFNFWRTASTELVALAPKAPFIGPKGSFVTDVEKWATANTDSHPYLQYDGMVAPQRQPFSGVPAGALQEALNSADDIKSIIGIYDASLGARSNETSGRAIMARQKESDIGTFHFVDNLSRAIKHGGKIMLDLIPAIYSGERVIRILGGEDGKEPQNVRIGQSQPIENEQIEGVEKIYNLTNGKYDITVDTGPSFTTKRQEAATQMSEFMRSAPDVAPLIGDLLAKNLDWPGAEEIARRLKIMLPPQLKDEQQDPQVMAMKQQMQQLQAQMEQIKMDKGIELKKVDIDAYNAETNRLKATQGSMTPDQIQALVMQTLQQVMNSPDILMGSQQ